MIEDKNVKHAKRVEHYQKAYQQATKHHHALNKINLFLGYLPGYTSVTSIFNVAKDIRQFELLLGQYGYFPFDYLFQYQRVVQLAENGEYGMLFFNVKWLYLSGQFCAIDANRPLMELCNEVPRDGSELE